MYFLQNFVIRSEANKKYLKTDIHVHDASIIVVIYVGIIQNLFMQQKTLIQKYPYMPLLHIIFTQEVMTT